MIAIGLYNRIRAASCTFAGGSWRAAWPSSNLANPERSKVARSTTASTGDTKVSIDLGASYTLRLLAFDSHNLTDAGQVKWSLGTSSFGTSVYTDGSFSNWLVAGSVESQITEHGASNGRDFPLIRLLPSDLTARYITLEISDASNPAGYIDLGYAWGGPALLPAVGPEYGNLREGHITDLSSNTRSRAGSVWSDPVRRLRSAMFGLGALTATEADQVHEAQRVLGTVGRIVYVPDVADAAATQRRGFVGQMRELAGLENPFFDRKSNAISLEQG